MPNNGRELVGLNIHIRWSAWDGYPDGSTPNYPLPADLLSLITNDPGLSKQSRAANDLFRFAQFALPKGTHRIPDSFKHLKVTGIPFAVVPNLNECSSTRSLWTTHTTAWSIAASLMQQ